MATKTLNWQVVNMATLPADLSKKHAAIQTARRDFETAVVAAMRKAKLIPADTDVQFSHKWGKLSVAFVERGSAGTSGGTISLA